MSPFKRWMMGTPRPSSLGMVGMEGGMAPAFLRDFLEEYQVQVELLGVL